VSHADLKVRVDPRRRPGNGSLRGHFHGTAQAIESVMNAENETELEIDTTTRIYGYGLDAPAGDFDDLPIVLGTLIGE
jgi:hypothetical protein